MPTNGYDDQNRLTAWNRTDGLRNQSWSLSAVNDWNTFTDAGTTTPSTHGPTHEILTVGTATITHDSRGNMTTDEFAITRAYDINNKVSQAVVPTGSVRRIVGTHSYMYDALGRRVRKSIGGASPSNTVFAYNGEQIIADYASTGLPSAPLRKFVWGAYIDELVCQINGTTKYYIHRNQQYSTTSITAQSGTPAERYGYTSYGDLRVLNPNTLGIRTTPPMTRYTYTGREYDHECGTYHFRARIYSATLGRFTGHDPILYPDGYNTYAGWFAVSLLDPSGRVACPGGNWAFAGDKTGGEVIAGYSYSRLKWVCAQREVVATTVWDCCGAEVTQNEYRVATVTGSVCSPSVGLGIGGGRSDCAGWQSGVTDSSGLGGWSWSGLSCSITIPGIGASAGWSPGCNSAEAGLQAGGIGASIGSTGASYTTLWTEGYDFYSDALDKRFQKMIAEGKCTSKRKVKNPPELQDNPNRPIGKDL